MSDRPLTLFYSWQMWTKPEKGSNNNRNFILDALERATKQVQRENEVPIIIDRDTKDVPGTPSIMETIMTKIDSCDIYIADVSYVMHEENRYTPNPNVMIELGYALKQLTGSRLILVMNTALGTPEEHPLPFDFQHRRFPITFHLKADADAATRSAVKEQLVGVLKYAIELVIKAELVKPNETLLDTVERFVRDRDRISLDRLVQSESRRIFDIVQDATSHKQQSELAPLTDEDNRGKIVQFYLDICGDLLSAVGFLVKYGDDADSEYLQEIISLWSQEKSNKLLVRYFPIVFLIYIVGIMAISVKRWNFLKQVILTKKIRHFEQSIASDYISNIAIEQVLRHYELGDVRDYVIGNEIYPITKQLLGGYFINEESFERAFVTFEFLFALQFIYTRTTKPRILPATLLPRRTNKLICDILSNWGKSVESRQGLEFLAAGLFDSNLDNFREVLSKYTKRQQSLYVMYGGVDYLSCFEGENEGKS